MQSSRIKSKKWICGHGKQSRWKQLLEKGIGIQFVNFILSVRKTDRAYTAVVSVKLSKILFYGMDKPT